MNKDHILYGIIGTLVGVIIGYVGTNYLNRTYALPAGAASSQPAALGPASGELPPDHPPMAGNGAGAEAGGAGGEGANSQAAGDPQAEVSDVIQQARKDPSNFDLQMRAAGMYSQINRHEQALEFYERANKVKPNDLESLVKVANANFDLQRYEESAKWYQKALKVNPKNATVRMDLGLTYYLRQPRDLDKAIAEYRQVLSFNPEHEKTLQNLTLAQIEKGDLAAARESFQQLEKVNPGNQTLAQIRDRLK
ncbi:MAG TPA: tetratricopeptide repeat protein [Blastocatellia bacterium]|nr:tetratricopeptide repeat protein [Blastocatellia bacterium]